MCNQICIFIQLYKTQIDHDNGCAFIYDQNLVPDQRTFAKPCGVLLPEWGTLSRHPQKKKEKKKDKRQKTKKKDAISRGFCPPFLSFCRLLLPLLPVVKHVACQYGAWTAGLCGDLRFSDAPKSLDPRSRHVRFVSLVLWNDKMFSIMPMCCSEEV